MSISSEIARIAGNVSSALTAIANKGVTVPSGSNSDDLADLIGQISGGGGGTPAISVVDTTDTHGGTIREITALDISDTTAVASDVAQGKYFYTAQGVKTAGTGSGGTPSATAHTIYFEFSDNTNTTITAYYDDSFISNAITATTPTTYGQKTVTLAQLDGVTWYEPANIPLNTQLIDYTSCTSDTDLNPDGTPHTQQWYYLSDFTLIDPSMTFSYKAGIWTYLGIYDENKNTVRTIYVYNDGTPDPNDGNLATGTLSGSKISGGKYVRIASTGIDANYMSLIRTA